MEARGRAQHGRREEDVVFKASQARPRDWVGRGIYFQAKGQHWPKFRACWVLVAVVMGQEGEPPLSLSRGKKP